MSYLTQLQSQPFLADNTGALLLQRSDASALNLGYAKTSQLRNTDLLSVLEAIPGVNQFRYDLATKSYFLGSSLIAESDLELVHLCLSRKYGINFPSAHTRTAVQGLAQQNAFDSYKEELLGIEEKVAPISIGKLSSKYFNTSDPIYDKFLELWLVNWVKRLIEPGSYHRTMLVLQGPQNIGKDQFAKILAGSSATASVGCNANFSDKDLLTTFNSKSILIFDELEQTTGRVVEGALKSFLSETCDSFVGKYKSHSEPSLRRFSCWGSCNKPTFLTDSTGNTRFHVIPVNIDNGTGAKINLDRLCEERLGIIAGALSLYRRSLLGEYDLQLSSEQALISEKLNRSYLNDSQFEEPLTDFLQGRSATCLAEVRGFLGFSNNHFDTRVDKEIKNVLCIIGWEPLGQSRNVSYSGGKRSVKPWVLKSTNSHDFHEMTPYYEEVLGRPRGRSDEF